MELTAKTANANKLTDIDRKKEVDFIGSIRGDGDNLSSSADLPK